MFYQGTPHPPRSSAPSPTGEGFSLLRIACFHTDGTVVRLPPSGREGDHGVVEGEGVYDEFLIITFDYVGKQFAITKASLV